MKSEKISLNLPPNLVAYLRFIVEGYDHLATISILNKKSAQIEISFHPTEKEFIINLLNNFKREFS